jgi:hypothetical protein
MRTFADFISSEYFKRQLLEAVHEKDELPNYVRNGKVAGYHYFGSNKNTQEEIVLDPTKFGKNSFTQNDVRSGSYPRIFFYVDLRDKESFFAGSNPVYKAEMPVKEIYSFPSDPLGVLRKMTEEGHQLGKVLAFLHEYGYGGVYYQTPNMKVLNWFDPIKAHLTDEATELKGIQGHLEKTKQDSTVKPPFDYDTSIHDLKGLQAHMGDFSLRNKSGGLTYNDMVKKGELQDKWDQETPERLKLRAERRAKGLF